MWEDLLWRVIQLSRSHDPERYLRNRRHSYEWSWIRPDNLTMAIIWKNTQKIIGDIDLENLEDAIEAIEIHNREINFDYRIATDSHLLVPQLLPRHPFHLK